MQLIKDNFKNECAFCGKELMKDGKQVSDVMVLDNSIVHKKCLIHYKREDQVKMLVLMTCYSIGDAITITPVLRELRRLYPMSQIDIVTNYKEFFKYNKNINNALQYVDNTPMSEFKHYDIVMDAFQPTNPKFPHHWNNHSVDFVSYGCLRKELIDKSYDVNYTENEINSVNRICKENGIDINKDKLILINPYGSQWETRSWSNKSWQELINLIENKSYKIVTIGGVRKPEEEKWKLNTYYKYENVIDMFGKFNLLETICFMDQSYSKCLVTFDSGPLHLAGCTKIPILGIFTVVKSRNRLPYRNGIKGYNCWSIDSECSCSYDHKLFTESLVISTCGKKDHLKKMLEDLNVLPIRVVINTINNYCNINGIKHIDYNAPIESIENFLNYEIAKYNQLPCIPDVGTVYKKFIEMISNLENKIFGKEERYY